MDDREFLKFMCSTSGRAATLLAKDVFKNDGPEVDDADLLKQVMGFGFPLWAAARIFKHCTNRYAPLTCRICHKRFTPKAISTCGRPYCNSCIVNVVNTPPSEEKRMKDRARSLAQIALQRGKLKRQPCESCGHQRPEMHHVDYSRPYHVIWLCRRCHDAEHQRMREEKVHVVLHGKQ